MKTRRFIFYCIIFLLLACSKDRDAIPPRIEVKSPTENNYYQLPHLLSVKFSVEDETQLVSVTVELTTETGTLIVPSRNIPVESLKEDITTTFNIDDVHLSSGYYYVKIRAGDGINFTSRYVRFRFLAVPRVLEKILVVTTPSVSTVNIDEISQGIVSYITVTNDFKSLAVNSWNQQIAIIGNNNAVQVVNAITPFAVYTIPSLNTNPPFFRYAEYSAVSDLLLVAKSNGLINAYTSSGGTALTLNITNGHIPLCISEVQQSIMAGHKNPVTGLNYFSSYNKTTNSLFQTILMNTEPKFISRESENMIAVFGNDVSAGNISFYDPGTGALNPVQNVPGIINDIAVSGSGTWVIAYDAGIAHYRHSDNSLSTIVNGVNPCDIAYDDINGYIYAAVGNEVKTYSVVNGALVNSVNFADPVKAIGLVYTR
jgi:hypothetical protein